MANENTDQSLFDKLEVSVAQNQSILAHFFVPIIATLFFIEALRAFVPGIYAAMFHVVFADPGWIGSLMTLLTIILLIIPVFTSKLCKKFGQKKIYLLSIAIIAIARVLLACQLPSLIQTVLAAVIIAFYGIFASIFLKRLVQNDLGMDLKAKVSIFSICFIAAFLLDLLLRTIGFSSDISLIPIHLNPDIWYVLQYVWLIIQVPLSLLLIWFALRTKTVIFPSEGTEATEDLRNQPWVLNATGLGMVLFLLFNIFLYPNAIAEFTDTSYSIINPIYIGAVILVLLYLLFGKETRVYHFKINICFNLILILALAAFLFLNNTWTYPIAILMTLSVGIMFLNSHLLITNASTTRKKGNQLKSLSKLFAYGFLFFTLMTFLHDFTTDYAFIIPAFQGLGPLILFIAGAILIVMTVLARLQLNKFEEGRSE